MAIGSITQPKSPPLENLNSKIYLLDIRTYTWVYTFEPSKPPNNTSSNPSTPSNPSTTSAKNNYQTQISANDSESNNPLTKIIIITSAICGILGTVILMIIGFFGYRLYQRRQQNEVLRVYGNRGNAV
jgi:hypothetical protein